MSANRCRSDRLVIISAIELREIRMPLVHFFETSFGRTTERRIILVRVTDAEGTEGWGECTAGEGPFYCEEWTETAWPTLKEFLAPMVVGQAVEDATRVAALMKQVGGNRMAKAAIEPAYWYLDRNLAGVHHRRVLAGVTQETDCTG